MTTGGEGGVTVADRIYQAMSEKGLSQRELARRIGVSRETVGRWLNEARVPTQHHAIDGLKRELGLTDGDLSRSATAPVSVLLQQLLKEVAAVQGELRDLRRRVARLEPRRPPPKPPRGSR